MAKKTTQTDRYNKKTNTIHRKTVIENTGGFLSEPSTRVIKQKIRPNSFGGSTETVSDIVTTRRRR